MLTFPIIIIPPKIETWRLAAGHRSYIVLGAGHLPLPTSENKLTLIGFQGSGILANRYIRNIEDARIAISSCISFAEIQRLMLSARGSISLQVFDSSDQSIAIFNDPLGGAPIYHYQGNSCVAYGTDLASLIAAIRSRGDKLHGEAKYFAAGHLTGTQSYGASTPYKEIDVVRRGFGIKIDAKAVVTKFEICPPETLYKPAENYDHGFENLREEIISNVRIAEAGSFESRYSHLTAGFDSRLVLAAIINQGLQDRFTFSCIEKSSDWEIAKNLAGELGLEFSGFDGNIRGTGYALNYYESMTRTANRSAGAIVSGIDPAFVPSNSLVFQGGYGEVGRTFNSFKWEGNSENIADLAYQMWQYASFPNSDARNKSIWSDVFLDEISSNIRGYTLEAAELKIESDFFTNYIYVEGRNRHWIGLQSYYASGVRAQFDPLYSRWLVSTPMLLDFEERRGNFLGFDLMQSLAPDLLQYPFDRPRIGWLYEKLRGKVPRKIFSERQPHIVRAKVGPSPEPWPGKVDHVESNDIDTAKLLGLSSLTVYGVRKYSSQAIQLIADDSHLRQIYRAELLASIWNQGSPQSKSDYIVLNNVIATLFLSGQLTEQ